MGFVAAGMYWAGWTDREEEGGYRDNANGFQTGQQLKDKPWYPGEPNGLELQVNLYVHFSSAM